MAKNLISDPVLARLTLKIFEWVLPLLDLRHCRKLSLYAILRKRYDPNSRKCKKLPFGPDLVPLGPYSGRQLFFFFQNLVLSVTRYHGQLSSCKVSEKNNDPISRKFSNGRPAGRPDREMDEKDFIGRCQTNVKRPK